MILLALLCAELMLISPSGTHGTERLVLYHCPRPSDRHGPRFETVTGAYQSRGVTPGGGKFVTITGANTAAPISMSVTDDVFDLVGTLGVGTPITLFGYVTNSLSGAQLPYSCIELAH
jgi:hypothetical protein